MLYKIRVHMGKKFQLAKSAFAKASQADEDKHRHRLLAEGLMHLTDAIGATTPPAISALGEVDRSNVYDRLVILIESRPGSPKVSNPYDLLIDDLGFEKATLANFAARVNSEFSDLKVNISRKAILKNKTVVDLANAVADDAEKGKE